MTMTSRLPLTKASIDTARKRGAGWHAIESPRGLLIRVTPAGELAWYLRYRLRRKLVMKKLAAIDTPIEAVRTSALDKLGQVALGVDPFAKDEEFTLRELVVEYERLLTQRGKKDPKRAKADLERACKNLLDKRPSELDGATLARWFANQTATRGKTSANRSRTMLLACLRATGARFDPFAFRSTTAHREEPRSRVLSDEEVGRLLATIATVGARERTYFTVLLRTGLRKTELAGLRRSELDLANAMIRIPGTRRKNGKPLEVPLDPVSLDLLKELRRTNPFGEYVFVSRIRGKHWRPDKAWETIRKDAGIPDVRLHDLRRSFGHRAALAGLSELEISAALGNTSLVAARHYTALAGKPAVVEKVRTAVLTSLDKLA